MSITGKILYDKIRDLSPDLSNIVTPEILDKISDKSTVQPFLRWFCENINQFNILSNEDIQLKKKLQESNEWLEGAELDNALEEATKDCPELLKIVSFDDVDTNGLFAELEITKSLYKEDNNYIHTLQNGIENLKRIETKLNEDIEREEELLDREQIEADKAYKECSIVTKQYDTNNREFCKEVECLLKTYADAAENKDAPLLWTQMPLKLMYKSIELYNHYLDVYIEQQFKDIQKEKQKTDSNYVSLINNSNEKYIDYEKLLELQISKKNLSNAKIKEILSKVQENSYIAMLDHAQLIYNSGNLKVPSHSELRMELSKLTKKRDFLEENVSLLQEQQLVEIVQQFAKLEITKVLKENANTRLELSRFHLDKLKNLRFLVRKHGHVCTDLLCMLMQIQCHCLKDVSEFVADAYHYLKTEYSLSSTRCQSMQQQQIKYCTIMASSPKEHNSFNQLFISMMCNGNSACTLNSALDRYNQVIDENKSRKQSILKTHLNSKINRLEVSENKVAQEYANEVYEGNTYTFKPISYEIEAYYTKAFEDLQETQADVTKIRNQMKERLKTDVRFEREKDILWQRFLIDPDTLRKINTELKETATKFCFAKNIKNK